MSNIMVKEDFFQEKSECCSNLKPSFQAKLQHKVSENYYKNFINILYNCEDIWEMVSHA